MNIWPKRTATVLLTLICAALLSISAAGAAQNREPAGAALTGSKEIEALMFSRGASETTFFEVVRDSIRSSVGRESTFFEVALIAIAVSEAGASIVWASTARGRRRDGRRCYLRNFDVVLSASTLPLVWHVAQ